MKENETQELLEAILSKLENPPPCLEIRREWIPKHEFQQYLGFGNTQMSTIERNYGFVFTVIGKKKFYSAKSILTILKMEATIAK